MSTRSPPVPSKNALRTLRHLALSHPLALTGALGSVCALATVNYEIYRRIKLAERVVANKTIIRSVSNNHGRAHVARVCEAAERGEGFSLRTGTSRKRRRVRHHSAIAFDQWTGTEEDVPGLTAALQKLSERPSSVAPKPPSEDPSLTGIQSSKHVSSKSSSLHRKLGNMQPDYRLPSRQFRSYYERRSEPSSTVRNLPTRSPPRPSETNSPSADRILGASQRAMKKQNHTVYARQTRQYVTSPAHEMSASLSRSTTAQALASNEPIESFEKATITPPPLSTEDRVDPGLTQALEQNSFLFDGPNGGELLECADSGSTRSIHQTSPCKDAFDGRSQPSRVSRKLPIFRRPVRSVSDLLFASRYQVAVFYKKSRFFHKKGYADAYLIVQSLRSKVSLEVLAETERKISGQKTPALLLDEISRCLDEGTPSSIAQAELLFLAFYREYRLSMQSIPCCRLAAHLLKDTESSMRASYMLFPVSKERPMTRDRAATRSNRYRNVQSYLNWVCQENDDVDAWVLETTKCVAAARSRGIPLNDRVVSSVLWNMVNAGQVRRAHELVERLKIEWNMEITFLGFRAIVHGFASDGDWISVQDIMMQHHSEGLSRTRPLGFSMLFQAVFDHYLSQKPLSQAYEYLMHAKAEWGLIPTTSTSVSLIAACLRHERFDLIQEWVETMRQLHPRVDIGTSSAMAAWRVAGVWREKNASCEEIEKGCQAMAYSAISDPFSYSMRLVAMEAVERRLRRLLSRARSIWQHFGSPLMDEGVAKMKFRDITRFVKQFVEDHHDYHVLPPGEQRDLREIRDEMKAVTRLNRIFAGEISQRKMSAHEPFSGSRLHDRFNTSAEERAVIEGTNLKEGIGPEQLLPRSELQSFVLQYYTKRQADGQKPSHFLLERLMPRMIRQRKLPQVLEILNSIYQSSFTQGSTGTPFSRALFSAWLYAARELKHGREVGKVVWAVVDSDLKLTSEFIVLLRLATNSRKSNKYLCSPEREQVESESDYLMTKLHRRVWIQSGMPTQEEKATFAEFEGWEERLRKSLSTD